MDAVEQAGCGHPGLPLGCAEIGAYLFAKALRYNPRNPKWINRDRFILSAGHGSMLLYTLLHLSGYDVPLESLKRFRQLNSPTAGHPEYGELPGIETTTGPLGQGLATATGMALGHKIMESTFDVANEGLLDAQIYCLASDGDIMEGISSEAGSLAGHLKLDNFIVFYDSNDVCLDGPTNECLSEDTAKRYEAYGWHVQTIDGHDFDDIDKAVSQAQSTMGQPSLIIAKTTIGKGSPNLAGTSEIHGKAMGNEEVKLTKEHWGIPLDPPFYIPESVSTFFKKHRDLCQQTEDSWQARFDSWAKAHPETAKKWVQHVTKSLPENIDQIIAATEIPENVATRQSSNAVLQTLHKHIPFLIGGSGDLSCSDSTMMTQSACIRPGNFSGRNIKYGVREFSMGAINSGLALQGMILPFCGTFLMFSDYMRNAIRLASLMKLHVIYQFTHDSILLGEDGPTHQPVEHLASLRAMPNLIVIRPGDATEVKGAWAITLKQNRPVALILSRQKVQDLAETNFKSVERGGYILKKETTDPLQYCLLATGSELGLAMSVGKALEEKGLSVRVVSIPSFELFNEQPEQYRSRVLGNAKTMVSIEAQSSFGWHRYIGREGVTISVDTFGKSAPYSDITRDFGFTTDAILQKKFFPRKTANGVKFVDSN